MALYDGEGRYAEALRGLGSLSLATDVPAALTLRRLDTSGLIWTPGPPEELGMAPLEALPLEPGSYLLTVRGEGRPPLCYPVHITRGRRWEGGVLALPGALPRGFVYVAPGPFIRGGRPGEQNSRPRETVWLEGFYMAVFPVTVADYCDFLNDLVAAGRGEEAAARCPRTDAGLERRGTPLLERGADGRFSVPAADRWGAWDPAFPVHSVSWYDARAYARWFSAREGLPAELPIEDQWEKAARGVDGRRFPWGDAFDASLAKIASSRPGLPKIEPIGSFPRDRSVYGVRDMAGSMRCWCADPSFDGDPERRPVKGGSYATPERVSRAGARYGSPAESTLPYMGIRLVISAPGACT